MSVEVLSSWLSVSVDDTRDYGAALAACLRNGDTVALTGDLGAGKTTLCQSLVRTLLGKADAEVSSPTFTLINEYHLPDGRMLWHVDLYRIASASELDGLGLSEALGAHICLIEWPDKAVEILPEDTLWLKLERVDETTRRISCAGSEAWAKRLPALKSGTP